MTAATTAGVTGQSRREREQAAEDAYAQAVADAAPPFTTRQRDRIAAALGRRRPARPASTTP